MKLWILIASLILSHQSAWGCDDSGAIYKFCDHQIPRLNQLQQNAKRDGKLMVVTFGADWDKGSRIVHNLLSHLKPQIADGIAFADLGLYMPSSMQQAPAGQMIRAQLMARNGLAMEQLKLGMPLIMLVRPSDSKVVFIRSSALKNGKRFNLKKASDALNRAVYKLQNS